MGAPPRVGDASSAPLPKSSSSVPPGPNSGKQGTTLPADYPVAPGVPDTRFQQPHRADPLKLMGIDEQRQRLTRGLRLYQDRHLDTAQLELKPLPDNPLAQRVLDEIKTHEVVFHARQLALVLRTLGQDAGKGCSFSEAETRQLGEAIDTIESYLMLDGGKDLNKAIAAAKKKFSPELLKVWECFAKEESTPLAELENAFVETDVELLAENLLGLAEKNRERKLYGTSWALAQIAAEYPITEKRAKDLIYYLEGQRTSFEYVLSDMFDHGGSSMAIDLLALAPSVALTRRLSTVAWLAKRRALVRIPLTMLAGGAYHWGSTKVIKGITGFSGNIMPGSLGEFAGEFTSSTLQNSFAMLLANRKIFWGRPTPTKQALAVVEGAEAAKAVETVEATATLTKPRLAWANQALRGGKTLFRGLWWTTKTGTKVGVIGTTDLLLVKTPLNYFNVHNMTQQGLPSYAMILFPKTRDTRRAVAETYAARKLFRDYKKQGDGVKKLPNSLPGIDAGLDLDLLLTQLDASLEGDKREATYAVLAEAAATNRLGLNIRRWILQKRKLGEFEGANRTFERQKIPLRYDAEGVLCFTDSEDYPCPKPPAKKP